jgi:hypothetical protein
MIGMSGMFVVFKAPAVEAAVPQPTTSPGARPLHPADPPTARGAPLSDC